MLRGLEISDMLIIDRLELTFQPGLNVLTGETGAGKSILLDCLGFVLGWRGRADLVRHGAVQGEVSAWFDLVEDHPAQFILDNAGLPRCKELILRRVNTVEGRKTAWVNDRRCSGEILRALSEKLIELHGQHDDRGLLNPGGHCDILDEFAGLDEARANTEITWQKAKKASKALKSAEDAMGVVRAEEEYLRHAVAELDVLDPRPGEDGELDTKRRLMQSAEQVRDHVRRAYQSLGNEGAEGAVSDAFKWLDGAAEKADSLLDGPLSALGRVVIDLDEALEGIATAMDRLSFNTSELEDAEERLFAIRDLSRKHQIIPDELAAFADDLRAKLASLDASDAKLSSLKSHRDFADAAYEKAAASLSAERKKAAKKLDKAVMVELTPLKMEQAVFITQISNDVATKGGIDAVTFTVATNPGAPSGPLNKIASGGELSRFLLAIKVCLTKSQMGLTMIFDEIDRGVGGATADAVGRRLASIAESGQVLVVTHSPQVAALGTHHLRVEKLVSKGKTKSIVVPLTKSDRVDEIARMLAGDVITDQARDAARVLLD